MHCNVSVESCLWITVSIVINVKLLILDSCIQPKTVCVSCCPAITTC